MRDWFKWISIALLGLGSSTFFPLSGDVNPEASRGALQSLERALDQAQPSWDVLAKAPFSKTALTRQDAERAEDLLARAYLSRLRSERAQEMDEKVLRIGDLSMPFFVATYGEAPADGRSMFLSMHGGGGAPARVNDQQWENQKRLYEPAEGVYVAPRAPTNTWNLWHQDHIDDFFQRLIQNMVLFHQVNPDKVYLMGYSAGGDGVYQLAPRMADFFAAASMMAGHPNETSPLGLRNLPFALYMGGKDAAYKRNEIAADWEKKLQALRSSDPEGYLHRVRIFPEFGHWMQKKDAEALPWMSQYRRQKYPSKVVWKQDDVMHERFYWLHAPKESFSERGEIVVSIDAQKMVIETMECSTLTLRLNDHLVDLDREVTILRKGQKLFSGKLERRLETMIQSLMDRGDPSYLFSASWTAMNP